MSFKDIRENGYHFKTFDEMNLEYLGITKNFYGQTCVIEKFSALSSGLYWIKICVTEAHAIVNKKFTNSSTFVLWHDRLGHPGSIMTRQIIENSNGHPLKNLKVLSNGEFSCNACYQGKLIFSRHEPGVTHDLVTGGAGYIGSHAALRLLKDSYRVTIVDNLSRGNLGAVRILQELFPEPGRFQFIYADLGDANVVHNIFSQNAFDVVMHFAAVAYVGESTLDPLKYYHNITSNTLTVLEAMATRGVPTLIYSTTCATYGEPEKMPITEETPQLPINPYGKAKKMAEDIILDFHKNSNRYFNVIGSDPNGRLGEAPRPELRDHGRISGACFDAARGIIPGLKLSNCLLSKYLYLLNLPESGYFYCLGQFYPVLLSYVRGTDYKTADGTCIRDYIDVTDLVDAHVEALEKARPGKVGIYNVGTGRGRSVKEFVEVCKAATRVPIKVDFLPRRPGDYAEVYSDPTKIQNELNWTAKYTDLQESLQIAWRWQKSHGEGYGSSVATS
ncbi:putative UDP-arabinose 4-epimerase 3 [Capsicum baccatum]|uniref:UDP-arabinose 4-epimerase 3 n=1 Tax=Capsicum baccatum TaxID=33114 RepID=A0A2G2XBC1_CAPBA|nr:putative UDP-arabinose 4-epimerase 3 [Capsicum baccatum]